MQRGDVLKGIACSVAAYEIAAVATGKPTLSNLSHRYWWFEAALLVAFAVDVHYLQKQFSQGAVPDLKRV